MKWAKQIQEICSREGAKDAASAIDLALDQYQSGHFVLSVIGMAKTGKSTLINALLGRKDDQLAPTAKMSATNVVSVFKWGEEPRIEVQFKGKPPKVIYNADEIKDYVTEEGNPDNAKDVYMVCIEGPYSEILGHLTIVDLPGLGSIHEAHAQVFLDHLPASDAVLLMTEARMPIREDERKLLADLNKMDLGKIFVAINKTDDTSAEELAQCEQHNREQMNMLGLSRKMHKLSAKQAMEGSWEGSGLTELITDLQAFIDHEKGDYMAEALVTAVVSAAGPPLQGLATRIAATGKSVEEIKEERARLRAEKQSAGGLSEKIEREFLDSWDESIRLALKQAR